MSEKISRRSFIKCAGAAVLAVSAAGVLAGCTKEEMEDIPEIPEVTTKEIQIAFFDTKTNEPMGIFGKMNVLKTATTVNTADVPANQIPLGYEIAKAGELEIRKRGEGDAAEEYIYVWVQAVKTTRPVTVRFLELPNNFFDAEIEVDMNATSIAATDIVPPEGYKLDPGYSSQQVFQIVDNVIQGTIIVSRS